MRSLNVLPVPEFSFSSPSSQGNGFCNSTTRSYPRISIIPTAWLSGKASGSSSCGREPLVLCISFGQSIYETFPLAEIDFFFFQCSFSPQIYPSLSFQKSFLTQDSIIRTIFTNNFGFFLFCFSKFGQGALRISSLSRMIRNFYCVQEIFLCFCSRCSYPGN